MCKERTGSTKWLDWDCYYDNTVPSYLIYYGDAAFRASVGTCECEVETLEDNVLAGPTVEVRRQESVHYHRLEANLTLEIQYRN